MARTRNLQVVISGDAKSLNRAFGQIDKSAQQSQSRIQRFGKVSAVAFAGLGAAAGGAAVVGLKKSADAAIEAEKSQARMVTQLKAAGIAYRSHAKQIDEVIQKTSRLSGLDDEDLQDSFTNIVRVTGDVNKSLKLTGLAADFARAKHIDVAKAGEIVGKVAGGNIGVLSRYGITIDKNASSSEALAALQKKFAGQAEAYGKTTAGSMDRASVASENLGEIVGAKLTPLLAKGATALVSLIDKSGNLAGPIRESTGAVRNAYDKVAGAVSRFVDTNRASINDAIRAARRLGEAFRAVFLEVVVPVVQRVATLVGRHLQRVARVVGDVIGVVVALINGDWSKAWDKATDIVKDTVGGLVGDIRDAGGAIWDAVTYLGKLVVRGIIKGMGNLGHAILGKVKDAAGWVGDQVGKLNPFGDGVGKAIGDGAGRALSSITPAPIPGGGMGEGLMGAQQALAPFAAVGSKFGLRVSSGRRPGSITSSGNMSYHATGEAIDEAGSPGGMMSFFRYMKSRFGGRLAELIYTPGGIGIKDGRPFRYSGQVAADHYDHVHVALDTGKPGVGDGLGMAAVEAARKAGFQGSSLVTALAVADAESGFNAGAQNLKYPDHSIGLWQINQLAHNGKYGSDAALKNPLANAKAAFAISGGGRNWGPWSTFTSGAYKRYLGIARKLSRGGSKGGGSLPFKVTGSYSQDSTIGVGQGSGFVPGMGSVSGTGEVTPYGGDFTPDTSSGSFNGGMDAGSVDAGPTLEDAINSKIATSSLTSDLGDDYWAKSHMLDLRRQQFSNAQAGGDPRAITEAAQALKSAADDFQSVADLIKQEKVDWANADLALAQLTDTLDDDKAALEKKRALDEQALAEAKAANDPRKIAEAANNLKNDTDALKALTQSVEQQTSAMQTLADELKRQNDFATSVANITSREAVKAMADIISGQIFGSGYAGRALTAGSGSVVRY